ncbi:MULTISPECIES: SDR family oxidoreductase [Chlamydia]|uniref:SDR family oxidoreductase n=1 Tax=Chlamydia buteonis TaxID=2494525 RepID=A0ABX8L9U9_9CHLA|nr:MULTISPECIES: SDR family oxidoreductase [Chlamydia]AFS19780.1 short chain dehydrogenase family protein [Chlamydia psittaci 84/55]AFS22969.1 short chain dehydrogenase family protein [Chlamydia psittaci VS225]EPJ16327.1 short chain dehydrogenase family protein [Chlamydia psittaci 02DC18]EPL00498.1 short chain dehydrogenase family protein [Chlamydia psittaci 02DC14]ADZ18128.1 short chain dehydrogenase reductase [Chlamydia psittaci 6BC]
MRSSRKLIQYAIIILTLFSSTFALATTKENHPCVVLTGASGQLGSAVTLYLHERDYYLLLIGRQHDKLRTLHEQNPNSSTLAIDYSFPGYLADYKKTLKELNRPIQGLIILTPRPIWGSVLQSPESWESTLQTTFIAQTALIQATLPYMSSQSSIVIIGGTTSIQRLPAYGLSCVIRRMWTTYAKALAYELGPKGIRVNVVSPGVVLTPFHKNRIQEKARVNQSSYMEEYNKETEEIPLRRHCESEELAKTIEFLLTPSSSFISGVNLLLDGGFTSSLN